MRFAVLIVTVASCFSPSFRAGTSCPQGACPEAGTTCLRGVCVVTGCAASADREVCSNTSVPDGLCLRGECIPVGCGDGVVEGNEVCDDGNRNDHDGCSANCDSNETCGNGHVDVAVGEECDDTPPGRS